mmetsp:Transcript_30661/g.69851  ORF Transcript_30661/g.69851 Transcript_30661/m.69851 type:complete len:163 (-) Transcript_30661:93-581(-)
MASKIVKVSALALLAGGVGAIRLASEKSEKFNPHAHYNSCYEVTDPDICLLTHYFFNMDCKVHGGEYCLPGEGYKCEDIKTEALCKDSFRQWNLWCNEWNDGSCHAPHDFDLVWHPSLWTIEWNRNQTTQSQFDKSLAWKEGGKNWWTLSEEEKAALAPKMP